ncbi:MAG TPA: hypothetical protein VFC13_20495, partial [Actinomycetes bacterium]|nr:hypothetical protein [Actinomycetes bacterium]
SAARDRVLGVRAGCSGCLAVLFMAVGLAGGLFGAVWLTVGLFEAPALQPVVNGPADVRVADKVTRALRYRVTGEQAGRAGHIVLTEAETNAFLSRHLPAAAEMPLTSIRVELPGHDRFEFAGQVPLGAVLSALPLPTGADLLPLRWLERPVWIRLGARASIETGSTSQRRYLRTDVEEVWVGRRRLPALLLRVALSPLALRVLQWPLPAPVEEIRLEAGQVVIRVGPSP